ncbi:hypothetical protein J5N97_014330 [Dioscorea zingiberensis]|uniref:Protein kinase domain-containing protein n=1 Tax=Dioscorea zingiberensis TaxID=325984 RepID=A0A9D5HJL6_9LILI|nr:hypothetical protein J5N97_014330 [Dioscorea zingiberensis]
MVTQPVTINLIWISDGWSKTGQDALRNAVNSLTSMSHDSTTVTSSQDVPTLGQWWDVVRQYRDGVDRPVTDKVSLGSECFYTGPHMNMTLDQVMHIAKSVFNQSSIAETQGNITCMHPFNFSSNSIHLMLVSQNVYFLDGVGESEMIYRCKGDLEVVVNMNKNERNKVKVSWISEPQDEDDRCSWRLDSKLYLGPPNGDERMDVLIGNTVAKVADEVTNGDGRGWSVSNQSEDGNTGSSLSEVCMMQWRDTAAALPLFRDVKKNVSFNAVGANGYRYILPYLWDERISNCALRMADVCGAESKTLRQVQGKVTGGISVNHTTGLQPYSPNKQCGWDIQYPGAKSILFSIDYVSISPQDELRVCSIDGGDDDDDDADSPCSVIQSGTKEIKITGSKASIKFSTGNEVPFDARGWAMAYSAGFCEGTEDIYDEDGVISYAPPTGFSYFRGLSCKWVLHAKPGTPVSLSFTHINTTKELDYVAVLEIKEGQKFSQVANFSGSYSLSHLPHKMNLTGKVMIIFTTKTDQGNGWSAEFSISSPDKPHRPVFFIAVQVSALVVVFTLLVLIILAFRKFRRRDGNTSADEELKVMNLEANKEAGCIGEGPSAIVYRADMVGGTRIAVKYLKEDNTETFDLEERILLRVSSHPHIVSFVGHSQDSLGRKFLAFEFMSRGTLSHNLSERGEDVSWEKRLTIALQIALALQKLHMCSKPPIYHGNLRSDNVLLDELWNAKLGGFGSANYCRRDGWRIGNQAEMEEDIENFGVVLVELLRGEVLNSSSSPCCPMYLDEVNVLVAGKECLDQRLELPQEDNKVMGLAKLGEIAKWCINAGRDHQGVSTRPRIGDVVLILEQVQQLFRGNNLR